MSQSCQSDLFVAFSRRNTGLGIQTGPNVLSSTYTLALGTDISWANAWYANPSGFGNSLMVNGQVLPSGSRFAYDAARVCES